MDGRVKTRAHRDEQLEQREGSVKRVFTAVLTILALSGAASRAGAAALETTGELRVRGWWLDNYLGNERSTEFWDQRLRLGVTWPVAENVKVSLRADLLEGMWGTSSDPTILLLEDAVTGALSVSRQDNRPQIAFDHVNLQFVVPGTPFRCTAGRQDVSWGTGYWVQADNRDRFQLAAKLDPVVLVVAYDKFTEVFAEHGPKDDWGGWAVAGVADLAPFKVGLIAAYTSDESRLRFTRGDLGYTAVDFFVKGSIGPVTVNAELNDGAGRLDRDDDDLDLSGLGAYLGIFAPVGGRVTVGLEGAYARGDDPGTLDENEGFFSADYQGPYWSVVFYNNLDYPGYAVDPQSSDPNPARDFSVRNAISGKASLAVAPVKGLTLTLAGLFAAADQTAPGVDSAMGWEFDFVAAYAVTDNVSVTAGVGYAVLGDYWKSAAIAGGSGEKPDNPLGSVVALSTRF